MSAKGLARPVRRRGQAFTLLALATLMAAPARGHEFWIDPVPPLAAPDDGAIRTDLRVGEYFAGDVFPFISSRFHFLRLGVGGKAFNLPGHEGDLPAVTVPASRPGLNVVAFFGKPNLVTFEDPALFAKYLATEGLDWVAEAHEKRGLPPAGFTEAFSRTAKTLIQVGPVSPADGDRVFGMPFELIATANPYALAPGERLPVVLLWDGKPAADTQLSVFQDQGQVVRAVLRTDAEGRADIPLMGGGRFLISAVHMREASPALQAVWESHWASLTFELPR